MNGEQSDYTQMVGRWRPVAENRLAQTVKLKLGANQKDHSLEPGSSRAPGHLPFAHKIDPESTAPAWAF
jgi:hypothetical protein